MEKRKINKIVLYILVVLVVVIIGYLSYKYFTGYYGEKTENNDYSSNVVNAVDEPVDSTINYNGYTYLLPFNIFAKVELKDDINVLHIYNNVNKWGAFVEVFYIDEKSSSLYTDYDKLEENLIKNGYNIRNKKIKNVNEKELVSFELKNDSSSGLVSYMPAYDNYEYEIVIYDGDDKSMNYDALDIILDILSSGEKIEE